MPTLDPDDVRELVVQVYPDAREVATYGASVLSFVVGRHSKESLLRFNIYLQTGTLGCCRVICDQVRECFKPNLSGKDALLKALQNPPKFEVLSQELFGDEDDLASKMELAEVGICVLMGERDKLQKHLSSLQKALEESSDESDEDDNTTTGLEFEYSLHEEVSLQADQCLQDIAAMGKQVTCVSTNGKGCVFLYGVGGVAYTPHIPKSLYQKFKSLKGNSKAPRPVYVSISTRDRFYASFLNRTFDWRGPKSLGVVLKKAVAPPRSVAFGANYEAYFVVHHDGSWECSTKGLPKEMDAKLSEVDNLMCVTMGPRGEWFMRTENGRLFWGGISDELHELVQSLLEHNRYLNFMDFGEEGSYFVSHD
jgi:hypothetical protein